MSDKKGKDEEGDKEQAGYVFGDATRFGFKMLATAAYHTARVGVALPVGAAATGINLAAGAYKYAFLGAQPDKIEFWFGKKFDAKKSAEYGTNYYKAFQQDARDYHVWRRNKFRKIKSKDILCGDIVLLNPGQRVPVDMILVQSNPGTIRVKNAINNEDCLIESLTSTLFKNAAADVAVWEGLIRCDLPSIEPYFYSGEIKWGDSEEKNLHARNLCLAGSLVQEENGSLIGIATYVGENTKIAKLASLYGVWPFKSQEDFIADTRASMIRHTPTLDCTKHLCFTESSLYTGAIKLEKLLFDKVEIDPLQFGTFFDQLAPDDQLTFVMGYFVTYHNYLQSREISQGFGIGFERRDNGNAIIAIVGNKTFNFKYCGNFKNLIILATEKNFFCVKIYSNIAKALNLNKIKSEEFEEYRKHLAPGMLHFCISSVSVPSSLLTKELDNYSEFRSDLISNFPLKLFMMLSYDNILQTDISTAFKTLRKKNIKSLLFTNSSFLNYPLQLKNKLVDSGIMNSADGFMSFNIDNSLLLENLNNYFISAYPYFIHLIGDQNIWQNVTKSHQIFSALSNAVGVIYSSDNVIAKKQFFLLLQQYAQPNYIVTVGRDYEDFPLLNVSQLPIVINTRVNSNLFQSKFALQKWTDINKIDITQVDARPIRENYLNLSDANLTEIPASIIKEIVEDKYYCIDLSNNLLEYLPNEFSQLQNLRELIIENNPLGTIPVAFRSWPKVKEYLGSIANSTTWNRCKVMVVGQEAVGKTSLLKAFQSKTGRFFSKHLLSTDGIEIIKGVDFAPSGSKRIAFDVWDFGGQEVFYPTHNFFLTSRAIYLALFRADKLVTHRLEYWMKTIKHVSRKNTKDCLVFLVGTHADNCSPEHLASVQEQLRFKFPKSVYLSLHNEIFFTSAVNGNGIRQLKTKIYSEISNIPNFFPKIAESWARFHKLLTSTAVAKEYISWKTFTRLAKTCLVPSKEFKLVAEFLSSTGTITYINDQSSDLNQFVVLNPQWLSNAMASIVTFKHSIIKSGKLFKNDIPILFKQYSPKLQQQLLGFLEKYKIIIYMKNKNYYLVPSFLDEKYPDELVNYWPNTLPEPRNFFEHGKNYIFRFLPLGFITQVIGRILLLPNVETLAVWRNGILFRQMEELALLNYIPEQYLLQVRIRFPSFTRIQEVHLLPNLSYIINISFSVLFSNIDSSNWQQSIPCYSCLTNSLYSSSNPKEPHQFPYETCIEAFFNLDYQLACPVCQTSVSLHYLAPEIVFSYIDVILPENLDILEKLGSGGFGIVHRAKLRMNGEWHDTAVKKLKTGSGCSITETFISFVSEITFMRQLLHPNLIQLYGIRLPDKEDPHLSMVMELMPLGDVYSFLLANSKNVEQFSWEFRILMILDAAKGMEYMESNQLVHRDLRTENMLLRSTDVKAPARVKVADFGLARQLISDASTEAGHLIWQYNPPERLDPEVNIYDSYSDIYSFAICMWEMATFQQAWIEFETEERFYKLNSVGLKEMNRWAVTGAISHDDLRPTIPADAPPALQTLIAKCWVKDRVKRPSFAHIVKTLTALLAELQVV